MVATRSSGGGGGGGCCANKSQAGVEAEVYMGNSQVLGGAASLAGIGTTLRVEMGCLFSGQTS